MAKTINQAEQYNAPSCEEHLLAVQRRILQGSPEISGENPGAIGEGFTPSSDE